MVGKQTPALPLVFSGICRDDPGANFHCCGRPSWILLEHLIVLSHVPRWDVLSSELSSEPFFTSPRAFAVRLVATQASGKLPQPGIKHAGFSERTSAEHMGEVAPCHARG